MMAEDSERQLLGLLEGSQSQSRLISITQELVRQASPNPPGDVSKVAAKAVELIREYIPSSEITTVETAPGTVNVVAVIKGNGTGPGRRLVFSGHLDTYPFGDEGLWAESPISGTLSSDGKRLYGRGSTDMKGGIAASIVAAQALATCRDQWSGELVIALAGDEETMGTQGSGYLLENIPAVKDCDAMICGDAGSPTVVRVGEKGLVWVEVAVSGKAAHGAHIHKGSNAIEGLLKALSQLKTLEDIPIPSQPEVDAAISSAKPISEPLGGEGEEATLRKITVNIGTINGGTSANLVPDKSHAAADIRLPVGITAAQVVEHIRQRLEPLPATAFTVLRQYDPSWTSPTEDIVRHSLSVAQSLVSQQAVVNMRVGASDARLFRNKGIPSVVLGLTPNNMGGPDEYVLVEELLQVAQIHALAAGRFLSGTQ